MTSCEIQWWWDTELEFSWHWINCVLSLPWPLGWLSVRIYTVYRSISWVCHSPSAQLGLSRIMDCFESQCCVRGIPSHWKKKHAAKGISLWGKFPSATSYYSVEYFPLYSMWSQETWYHILLWLLFSLYTFAFSFTFASPKEHGNEKTDGILTSVQICLLWLWKAWNIDKAVIRAPPMFGKWWPTKL